MTDSRTSLVCWRTLGPSPHTMRQAVADGIHVIELTTENFCEVLDNIGHEVTPQLQRSVAEYTMLATMTVMAVELALLPPA